MAYASWSVVFGEQPSAAKWNILGTNDASFNDGTGILDTAVFKQVKVGTFTITADGTKTVTGVGFKPKLVQFYQLSTTGTATGVNSSSYGVMDNSGNQFVKSGISVESGDSSQTNSTSLCIKAANVNGGTKADAAYLSMNSDGFSLTVTNYSETHTFGYIAFG